MQTLTLADVVEGLTGSRPRLLEQPHTHIAKTVIDSRHAEPGALFIALKGEHVDGHDYVADAFSRGAVAAIVERDVPFNGLVVDLTDPDRTLPSAWSQPMVIKVTDGLQIG